MGDEERDTFLEQFDSGIYDEPVDESVIGVGPVCAVDVYPTQTRLNLTRAIDAGKVRWEPWFVVPEARWREDELDKVGRKVTAEVKFLAMAGAAFVDFDNPNDDGSFPVALTEAGRVWLAESGGAS